MSPSPSYFIFELTASDDGVLLFLGVGENEMKEEKTKVELWLQAIADRQD